MHEKVSTLLLIICLPSLMASPLAIGMEKEDNQELYERILTIAKNSSPSDPHLTSERIDHLMQGDINHKTNVLKTALPLGIEKTYKSLITNHWIDAFLGPQVSRKDYLNTLKSCIKNIPAESHKEIVKCFFRNSMAMNIFSSTKPLQKNVGWTAGSYCIAYSPGLFACDSPSDDEVYREIKVVDMNTDSLIKTLGGHKHFIQSIAINQNGTVLASACDHFIKLWNISAGLLEHEYPMDLNTGCRIVLSFNAENILKISVIKVDKTIFVASANCQDKSLKRHTWDNTSKKYEPPLDEGFKRNAFPHGKIDLLQAFILYKILLNNRWRSLVSKSTFANLDPHYYVLAPELKDAHKKCVIA